jgi:predicted permease
MILIGVYTSKKNIITKEINKKLSELLLNVTLPFLIIISFQFEYSKEILNEVIKIFIISLIFHIFCAIISKFIYKKFKKSTYRILSFVTVFSNCAFMGYPIVKSVYPETGIIYASMYVVVFNIFLWSYGIILFTGKKDSSTIKLAILNPGIISIVIGLALYIFSIKLPTPIYDALDMVGSMTTPMSMLITGAILADSNIKDIFKNAYIYLIIALRLVVLPLLLFAVLYFLNIRGPSINVIIIVSAMPAAAATVIYSEKYDADSYLASKIVTVSTAISIITLPLIIFLLTKIK